MDEGTGKEKDEALAHDKLLARVDDQAKRKTDSINENIKELNAAIALQPDTPEGRVQRQIGDLGIAILQREKAFWLVNQQVWGAIVDTIFDQRKALKDRPNFKESFQIAATMIAVADKQTANVPPKPPDPRITT